MNQIICDHVDAEKAGMVCEHLLNKGETGHYRASEYYRLFTGHGADFVLICRACAQEPEKSKHQWRTICDSCVEDVAFGNRLGNLGSPEIVVRDAGLTLEDRLVQPGSIRLPVMVVEPGRGSLQGSWLVLTMDGELKSFESRGNVATSVLLASDLGIDCDRPSTIVLSPDGRFAAVANTYERTGVVVDLSSGTSTMRLARGNYYPEHCKFPMSFFEHNGRQLLIHATDWNRLDISDPATGELLTVREPTAYKRDEQRPSHYLDYFHCGLSVSPDGQWIADNGWSWHPVGIITTWSLTPLLA